MTESLFSHKWFFKSSGAASKQNRSDYFYKARTFLKNIRSYWLEPDKNTITGPAKSNIHIVTSAYSSGIRAFHFWNISGILQDRWKHKTGNRCMHFFHCYPFDLILFCWQLKSLMQLFSWFLNARIRINNYSFFRKDFNQLKGEFKIFL